MAAPLVPLSQQVRCWGASGRCGRRVPPGGRGVAEASSAWGTEAAAARSESSGCGAAGAGRALKVTGRRGPRTLGASGCGEETGRGRRACPLNPGLGRAGGGLASRVAVRARGGGGGGGEGGGPSLRSLSPTGSGVGTDGVPARSRAGIRDAAAAAASPAAQPCFPGEPLPLPCGVRRARRPRPRGGRPSASSKSPDAFLEEYQTLQGRAEKPGEGRCAPGQRRSFILRPLFLTSVGSDAGSASAGSADKVAGLLEVTP